MDWTWIVYGISVSIFAVYIFGIGLRGLVIKRPLALASRQQMWIMFFAFIPSIIMILRIFILNSNYISTFSIGIGIFQAGLLVLLTFMLWRQMSGYMFFGISDETFQEALINSLKKLDLPYKETVSKIKLTSIDAELQVIVTSWMGTAQIRVKQPQHAYLAKDIADSMNDYFKNNEVKVNNFAHIANLVLGSFMIAFALFIAFGI